MKKKQKTNFFLILMILILFEPNIFVKNDITNFIFIFGAIISFIYVLIIKFRRSMKIFKITLLVIIDRMLLIILTLLNRGDILKVGYQSLTLIALFFYAEYFYSKNNLSDFIKIVKKIFFLYLFINIVLYYIFPNGLYLKGGTIHFLGIRTRFTEYSMTLILLSILSYVLKYNSKRQAIVELIIAILNIIIPKISTAIIGVLIFAIMYYILSKIKKMDYRFLLYIGIVLTILVVFFRIQTIFSFIIEDILNKNISLTGRTEIWDLSYKYIFDKMFFLGHGLPIDGNFILWGSKLWQAHNQLLQNLYEGGIVGTFLFYMIIGMSLRQLSKCDCDSKYKNLVASMIFAFLIMMITEIYGYYNPLYIIIILGYFSNSLIYQDDRENK